MPMVERDSTGTAKIVALGHALPKYRWSIGQTASYKRLNAYALLDAVQGTKRLQSGQAAGRSWTSSQDEDQAGKRHPTVKPLGYYYRAGAPDNAGTGGLYDILGPNSAMVEDASFVKLREVTVGYHIGASARSVATGSIAGHGPQSQDVDQVQGLRSGSRFRGSVRHGWPAGNSAGSAAINAVDAFQFPNLRTFTVSLSTSF